MKRISRYPARQGSGLSGGDRALGLGLAGRTGPRAGRRVGLARRSLLPLGPLARLLGRRGRRSRGEPGAPSARPSFLVHGPCRRSVRLPDQSQPSLHRGGGYRGRADGRCPGRKIGLPYGRPKTRPSSNLWTPPAVTGRDGREAVRLMEGIYASGPVRSL